MVDFALNSSTPMDANFIIMALFALGVLVAALPWWPYRLELWRLDDPGPISATPSFPDLV